MKMLKSHAAKVLIATRLSIFADFRRNSLKAFMKKSDPDIDKAIVAKTAISHFPNGVVPIGIIDIAITGIAIVQATANFLPVD